MNSRVVEAPLQAPPAHGGGQWTMLRGDIRKLESVIPADVNDACYGPAPEVWEALQLALRHVHHSPEVESLEVRRQLASTLGIPERSLLVGAGSSPLIHFLVQSACHGTGARLLVPSPTYSEYERIARLAGAAVYRFLLQTQNGFRVDPKTLGLAATDLRATLVALPNPNNPTGLALCREDLGQLLTALPRDTLLLIDEAYIDYSPESSFLELVLEESRVCVIRSLSKGRALSGVRVGYAVVGSKWAEYLPWNTHPWCLNLFAQAAIFPALAASDYVRREIQKTLVSRDKLARDLSSISGVTALDSHCHFFLIDVGRTALPATGIVERLEAEKVLVKSCHVYGQPLSDSFIRVTTRTPNENRQIVEAFRRVLSV